jgi:hypothetical protein
MMALKVPPCKAHLLKYAMERERNGSFCNGSELQQSFLKDLLLNKG